MNPGVAVDRTTVLPQAAARSAAASATSGAVARAVGDREEVLEARIASTATTCSSSPNSARLTARSSTTASITTPQPARPATESAAVTSSASGATLRRPVATCALTRSRMPATARSAAPGTASVIRTRRPATAATWAIPAPIVPAPTTPIAAAPIDTVMSTTVKVEGSRDTGGGTEPRQPWSRGGLEVIDADRVACQDRRRRVLVGHEPGDRAGVGGDAGDARPVGAEDHPLRQPAPVLPC